MEHYTDDPPQLWRLHRTEDESDIPLEFEGWQIAAESSRMSPRRVLGSKTKRPPTHPPDRWTEIRVYRTTSGRWVTEYLGCSVVEGERTLRRLAVCDTPEEVHVALRHRSSDRLSGVASKALRAAADLDPDLHPALVERV